MKKSEKTTVNKKTVFSSFRIFLLFVSLIFMIRCLPHISNWLQNKYQVTISDLILPLVLSLLSSILIAAFFYKSFFKNPAAAFAGAIIVALITRAGYETRFSNFYPWLLTFNPVPDAIIGDLNQSMLMSLMFIILVILLGRYVFRLLDNYLTAKKWPSLEIAKVIYIFFSVAFLLQIYPLIKVIVAEWPQFYYRPAALAAKTDDTQDKPDVYYIVLDRYTSKSVLGEQFNYSNADFSQFLSSNGYFVKENAMSSYPRTTSSIASTLNANYLSDTVSKFSQEESQTLEPYHNSIRYAPVIKMFKEQGYNYYHLGSWYEASNQAPLADYFFQKEGQLYLFNHRLTLNEFSKNQIGESVWWRFIEHGVVIKDYKFLYYQKQEEKDATLENIEHLKNIAASKSGGRFIFAHFLIPHDPYFFNADGSFSIAPKNDNINLPVKEKYLGQVQYINSQMKEILELIKKNSGDKSIVILQSDEGPYPAQLDQGLSSDPELSAIGGDMTKWTDQELRMKYGILAAYHIPKASQEAINSGADSVNVFRLVFNTYFGGDFKYLPRCFYAYSKGNRMPFAYTEISEKLTGTKNTACSPDSSK